MELGELAHGREAAAIFGVTRPDEVWREVRLHGDAYPGALNVYTIGRKKAVPRAQLCAFAAWYRECVSTQPDVMRRRQAARRVALRTAIRSIKGQRT